MPPLLRAVYEILRDSGAYEVDWIDRACWRAFWAFVAVVVLLA